MNWMNVKRKHFDIHVINFIFIAILFLCIISQLKSILVSIDVDEEYVLAMYHRLAQNDIMLLEMWESHQLSAILGAWLAKLYVAIAGTEYIVSFFRVVGVLCSGLTALYVFKRLDEYHVGYKFLPVLLVFIYNPKKMLLPEWSNFVVWGALIMFFALVSYLETKQKKYLIHAGIGATIASLAIWSFAIVVVFVCIGLVYDQVRHKEKIKDIAKKIGWFLLVPIISVAAFLIYLLFHMNLGDILDNITYITNTGIYGHTLWQSFVTILSEMALFVWTNKLNIVIAFFVCLISCLVRKKISLELFFECWLILLAFSELRLAIFGSQWYMKHAFVIILYALYLLIKDKKYHLCYMGIICPVIAWLTIAIISCVPFHIGNMYLFPAEILAIVFILKYKGVSGKSSKSILFLTGILFVMLSTLAAKGWAVRVTSTPTATMQSYEWVRVTDGPLKGVWVREADGLLYNENVALANSLENGSKILYLGYGELLYLAEDKEFEICTPSLTIGYPSHEVLEDYYLKNPEKKPDIVIIEKAYDELLKGRVKECVDAYFGEYKNATETETKWIYQNGEMK